MAKPFLVAGPPGSREIPVAIPIHASEAVSDGKWKKWTAAWRLRFASGIRPTASRQVLHGRLWPIFLPPYGEPGIELS